MPNLTFVDVGINSRLDCLLQEQKATGEIALIVEETYAYDLLTNILFLVN